MMEKRKASILNRYEGLKTIRKVVGVLKIIILKSIERKFFSFKRESKRSTLRMVARPS